MTIGVVLRPDRTQPNLVDDVIEQATELYETGVDQIWLAQQFDHDAISLAGLVGAAVTGLGVGTFVVPINPRHPLLVAAQAQTAQAATHGRFSLGLGLGSHEPERHAFGVSWPDPAGRLREHLTVLRSVFDDGAVDHRGPILTAAPQWPVSVPGGTPIPVYVAAMGPKALQVTGELADGTLPYLAGPRAIAEFIEPALTTAATAAGRPRPRIIAAVPVLVTADVDAGRAVAAAELGFYNQIPSYQRILAREGVSGAADLAIVGDEDAVGVQLQRYLDAGATDLVLSPLGEDRAELRALWRLAGEFDGALTRP